MDGAEANLVADVVSMLAVAAFMGVMVVSLFSGASLETAFFRGAVALAVVGVLGWLALRVLVSGGPRYEEVNLQDDES